MEAHVLQMDKPRVWQERFVEKALAELHSGKKKSFLLQAWTGAGKSDAALIFARAAVDAGLVEHVHVFVPTAMLVDQWIKKADLYGLSASQRTNRGLTQGRLPIDITLVVSTYAQVAQRPDAHSRPYGKGRVLYIMDECHHIGEERSWGKAIIAATKSAVFRLYLSGTPFRSDGQKMPHIDYEIRDDGTFAKPDFEYTYPEAIDEQVCRVVLFKRYGGTMEYSKRGETFKARFSDNLPKNLISKMLGDALHPDAGLIEWMVREANDEITEKRKLPHWKDAAGVLLAMNQAHARKCAKLVEKITGEPPVVVVSDNGQNAKDDLRAFRNGSSRWIIAVRMVSEGVDIPRLAVAVHATNVIATLFFRQFVGRIVRQRPSGKAEIATFYFPSHPDLVTAATDIESVISIYLRDNPGKMTEAKERLLSNSARIERQPPTMSDIGLEGLLLRGEEPTADEIERAKRAKASEPWARDQDIPAIIMMERYYRSLHQFDEGAR